MIKQKVKETKDKIIIEKDNKGKLIDDIEDIIRKEINIILKTNEKYRKKGKEISICKKEYMKKISNFIKTVEVNIDKISVKSSLFELLKECITNNIINISQNENNKNIIKEDFILFLKTKPSEYRPKKKRDLGIFKESSFYMADDFDETPACFKEYV